MCSVASRYIEEHIIKQRTIVHLQKAFKFIYFVLLYAQTQLSTKNKTIILGVLSFLLRHVYSYEEINTIFALELNLSLVQLYI